MTEENTSQEFRLYETRNYFLKEIEQNELMSKKHKNLYNTISLSRHEQICLMRLRFERYFSHHDVINLLYYEH